MPIFRVKSVKIYTGQKNLHWRRRPRRRQLSGMSRWWWRKDDPANADDGDEHMDHTGKWDQLHIWWWWGWWYLLWSFWKDNDTDDESDGDEHIARADGTSCTSAKSHCSSQWYASDTNGFGSHHLYHIKTGITDSTPPTTPQKKIFCKNHNVIPFFGTLSLFSKKK